jgi:hypothetical protein
MQRVSCDCTSFCCYGVCVPIMCNTAGGHTHRAQILTGGQLTAPSHKRVNKQQTKLSSEKENPSERLGGTKKKSKCVRKKKSKCVISCEKMCNRVQKGEESQGHRNVRC